MSTLLVVQSLNVDRCGWHFKWYVKRKSNDTISSYVIKYVVGKFIRVIYIFYSILYLHRLHDKKKKQKFISWVFQLRYIINLLYKMIRLFICIILKKKQFFERRYSIQLFLFGVKCMLYYIWVQSLTYFDGAIIIGVHVGKCLRFLKYNYNIYYICL